MSAYTTIEWTEARWNPVRGCQKTSPGCKSCYAERLAERFRGVAGNAYSLGFDVRLVPDKLVEPLRWSQPHPTFVNSMSDLFQDAVPDDYIVAVVEVMAEAPWHSFQVLTKRPGRMGQLLATKLEFAAGLPHIWWGASVENRRDGLPRVDMLRSIGVPVRFLSIEPLLEELGDIDLAGISWVIVGGESGPGARPMRKEWVEAIRRQCEHQRIRFFFKQWGGVNKKKSGRGLNGRTYDDMPPLSQVPIADRVTRQRLIRETEARYGGRFSGDVIIPNARLVRKR
jgi:protein gp37